MTIDITGDNSAWEDNVGIYELTDRVRGNDIAAPLIDGDSNIPLRQLANRTARIKKLLDTYGIFVKDSEFTYTGQHVIYNAPLRGDIVDGNAVSYYNNEFWNLDTTQTDSRKKFVGIADKTNNRVVTGGLFSSTLVGDLSASEGDPIYCDLETPGKLTLTENAFQIGIFLFSNIMLVKTQLSAINILNLLKTVDGSGSGLDADLLDGHSAEYFTPLLDFNNHLIDNIHPTNPIFLNNNNNLNDINDGWYKWDSTLPENAPFSYAVLLQAQAPTQSIQIAFGSSGQGRIAIRRADSGIFYEWTEFLASNEFTGSNILNLLKTVDGPGSGLNADMLDGHNVSYLTPLSTFDTHADNLLKHGNVDALSARTTVGTWTLTGLTINRPLFILFNSDSSEPAEVRFRAASGTYNGRNGNSDEYYQLSHGDNSQEQMKAWTSVCIPTNSTVSFYIGSFDGTGAILRAYQ